MSVLAYGVQFRCDLCGVTANGPGMDPGPIRYDEMPRPEGWTALSSYDGQIALTDAWGSRIEHLCPLCGGLSIGGFVARFRAKVQTAQAMRTG